MDVFCQTIIDTWAREDTYPMDDWANSDIDSSLRKFQAAVAGFKGILKFERSQNTAVKDEDGNVLHFKINPWGMGGFFADKVKPGQRQIEVDELIDIVKDARIEVARAKKRFNRRWSRKFSFRGFNSHYNAKIFQKNVDAKMGR